MISPNGVKVLNQLLNKEGNKTKSSRSIELTITKGYKKKTSNPHRFWETVFYTEKNDVPTDRTEVIEWVKEAHLLIDDWFFKLIEGELEKRFE